MSAPSTEDVESLKDHPVLDTSYTWGFYAEQSPVRMSYVARINGARSAAPDKPFRYLELGCGNAVTSNILAAAMPHGEFYAADLNPEHVRNGTELAKSGGVGNLTILQGTFESLLGRDLPTFDYVALHGVYSWISPAVRRDVVAVMERFLAPGGLAYVSYNALPGWAGLLPLREFMLSYARDTSRPTIERAADGLRYLKFLRDNQAAYFQKNPDSGAMLDLLLASDLHYVVHEYFNESWQPQYFSEVAAEMAVAGLSYCGSANIANNYSDISTPEAFHALLNTAPDQLVRETHKSLILNERFRMDVYCRDAARLPVAERIPLLAATVAGSAVPVAEVRRELNVPRGTLRFSGDIFDSLVPAAAPGLHTVAELAALPELAGRTQAEVATALSQLVVGGQYVPFLKAAAPVPDRAPRAFRLTSRLNRALLERRLLIDGRCPLASTVLGSGVWIDLATGLLLLAGEGVALEQAPGLVWDVVSRSGRTMRVDDKPITDAASCRAEMEPKLAPFRDRALPILLKAGIVRAAEPDLTQGP